MGEGWHRFWYDPVFAGRLARDSFLAIVLVAILTLVAGTAYPGGAYLAILFSLTALVMALGWLPLPGEES